MKRISTCVLLALLLSAPLAAQEWTKVLGGTGFEYGYRVAPMPDGGFMTAGTKSPPSSSDEDFWIARFDKQGNRRWDSTYGRKGVQETLFGFLATKDYGFMVGGFTGRQFSGNESATMYRGDSTGKLLWKLDVDYASSDHWHFFVERKDGGYYMGGHTDSKGGDAGEMWLVRMDSTRQFIWERTYGRGIGTEEHAHMGLGLDDGGALMLGHTENGGREKWFVARVDSNGDRAWDKIYSSGDDYHDSPYGMFQTRDGNYALIGGSSSATNYNSTMWLLVIDGAGKILLDKHYGDPNSDSFAWNAHQTSDGGYLLAGYTSYKTKGRQDIYVVKTDAAGTVEWTKTYGGTDADYGYDAIETADGWVAVGSTESPELQTGGNSDLLLVKWAKDQPTPPQAPVLVSPANGKLGAPLAQSLTWGATAGADRYRVQVATEFTFASPLLNDSMVTGSMRTVSGLELNRKYYWRVQAINAGGAGPWSEIWSFTTAASGVATTVDAGTALLGAAPNPFRTMTNVALRLGGYRHARVSVVDMYGHVVQSAFDGDLEAGEHLIRIDGTRLPAGSYLAVVQLAGADGSGAQVLSERLTVIR